jgi:hypothetical protein
VSRYIGALQVGRRRLLHYLTICSSNNINILAPFPLLAEWLRLAFHGRPSLTSASLHIWTRKPPNPRKTRRPRRLLWEMLATKAPPNLREGTIATLLASAEQVLSRLKAQSRHPAEIWQRSGLSEKVQHSSQFAQYHVRKTTSAGRNKLTLPASMGA